MLYALVATLVVERLAEIAPTTGHFAHALFLDLVRQVDPDLAEVLHDRADRKPFTVSPLLHESEDRPLTGVVQPGQRGRLRLTILDDRVFATLIRKFRADPWTTVRAGSASLIVADVTTVPGRWSGAASLEEIWDNASPRRTVTLHFATPTSFSLGNGPAGPRLSLFPSAGLVFGGLHRRWNTLERETAVARGEAGIGDQEAWRVAGGLSGRSGFPHPRPLPAAGEGRSSLSQRGEGEGEGTRTGRPVPAQPVLKPAERDEFARLLDEQVVETAHDLRTLALQIRDRPEIGFTGWCSYEAKGAGWTGETLRQLNALADFAFYAGVGRKTTMGLGQTRRTG